MELTQLRNIVEGALLAAGQPLSVNRLKNLFEEHEEPETAALKQALELIANDCEGRGFELKEVASGYRLQVRSELAPWVNRLWEERPQKYSRALLETLALVAYRQPITRGDIEEIRGVAVSSHIIKTLTEREWVKVVGQRDVPGRPSLYATTRQFLDYFNLQSLEELPSLGEIRDLDDMNEVLDLIQDENQGEPSQSSEPEESGQQKPEQQEHDTWEADQELLDEVSGPVADSGEFSADELSTLDPQSSADGASGISADPASPLGSTAH